MRVRVRAVVVETLALVSVESEDGEPLQVDALKWRLQKRFR